MQITEHTSNNHAPESRALLISVDFGRHKRNSSASDELGSLAKSAGISPVAVVVAPRKRSDPTTMIGKGKIEQILALRKKMLADTIIFNLDISSSQQRNLERMIGCKVIDRTSLILDIFAKRARSFEGKLQVEMARCQDAMNRLVRGWTHLERQRGGIGQRGGPGEKQLEIDRRMIANRIKTLDRKLKKYQHQSLSQLHARQRSGAEMVSLVGYTNAGKSTLFNRLTGAKTSVSSRLFDTLDSTARRLYLSRGKSIVLSDTVGFIQGLPHALIAAFKATLQEAAESDLLLHVVDISDPKWREHMVVVEETLDEIGALSVPRVLVCNKADLVGEMCANQYGKIPVAVVSASMGYGILELRQFLTEVFVGSFQPVCVATSNTDL